MGMFTRKSRWDYLVDSAGTAISSDTVKHAGRWGAGIVAGFVSLTAVNAAITSARRQEGS